MMESKKDSHMLSPQSNLRNSFKPTNLTAGIKSMQTVHSPNTKVEQKKANTINPPTKTVRDKPEEHKIDKSPPVKKVDPKATLPTNKKPPITIDSKTAISPRNIKQDALNVKSPEHFSQPSSGSISAKQQLRTTFSPKSIIPSVISGKDALRKTTLGTNRPTEAKSTTIAEVEKIKHQVEAGLNEFNFKKHAHEKRPQNHNPQSTQTVPPPTPFSNKPSNITKTPQPNTNGTICGFSIGKTLGSGRFGQVYLARHNLLGFICALKRISKAKAKDPAMQNLLVQEIKLHSFLNHPNIVQFYGYVQDDQNIYLILQYMEGGTLFDYLNNQDTQRLSQLETANFIRQITEAVKYIHDLNIAHRDIKPQNIVLNYGIAKLCDFGWSTRVLGPRDTVCGTAVYAPPQMLQKKCYDLPVDLWCLGMLTYELLVGRMPFEGEQKQVMMQKIVNVDKQKIEYPPDISPVAKDFIENLVKKNPKDRTKTYKLLSHPFLERLDQKPKAL